MKTLCCCSQKIFAKEDTDATRTDQKEEDTCDCHTCHYAKAQ